MRWLPLIGLTVLLGSCGGGAQGNQRTAGAPSAVELDLAVQVRVADGAQWAPRVFARAGETVEFRITLSNRGSEPAREVVLIQRLPAGLRVIRGSAAMDTPARARASDPIRAGLLDGGLELGALRSLEAVNVELAARVRKEAAGTDLRTVVTAGGLRDVTSASARVVAVP
jgi:uncharacterized repeat protein (TIGR01451 family)